MVGLGGHKMKKTAVMIQKETRVRLFRVEKMEVAFGWEESP